MNNEETTSALDGILADDSVPTWAKVLINCFRNQRGEAVSLSQRISLLEERMATKDEENRILKIQMAGLRDELDAAEQYSRRNCLIFHGISEIKGESTSDKVLDIIHNNLGVNSDKVSVRDIHRSHRLGKFVQQSERTTRASKQRSRPIIVKFKGYDSREEVFKNKRYLKGSGVMVTENLTAKRYKLLLKCFEKLGKGNVWTLDGRITTKIENKYITINDESDLEKL